MDRLGWKPLTPAVLALLLLSTCMPALYSDVVTAAGSGGADNIQLLYFHRTERCQSCNNAEQYARETLDRYFGDEMKSGKLAIQSIDYQKDRAMAEKYGVKMQGLKLKITKDGQETVRDVPEVWALVRDKEACMGCLRTALDRGMGR
jgi:hypothetical protein